MYISRLLISSALAFTVTIPSYASNDEPDKAEASTTNPGKRPADDDNSPARPDRPDEQPKKHQAEDPDLAKIIEAAKTGNADALYSLGITLYKPNSAGVFNPKKTSQARAYFKMAADQGHTEAQYQYGMTMLSQPNCDVISQEYLQKAADQGHADAQYRLGFHFYLKTDKVKAEDFILKAALQGNASAQNYLGFQFWHKDIGEALKWFLKAAKQGDKNTFVLNRYFNFQPNALMNSASLHQEADKHLQIINSMTAYYEFNQLRNIKEEGHELFANEAMYALDSISALYAPLYRFGDRLSVVLTALYKSPPGLMVSCVKATDALKKDCIEYSTKSLYLYEETITFGEENVRTLQQFTEYLKIMKQEFHLARQALDVLINSLYPPVASLRACQRAALSGNENAILRFKQEKEEYDEILSINKDEINRLKQYKAQLDVVEQGLTDLLPSTIGSRNKEFIESEEFSFLKP